MTKYLKKVKEIGAEIPSCEIQKIPRSENARTDRLARLAILQMADLDNNVHLVTLEARSIDELETILCASSKPSWMDPIIDYLKSQALPAESLTARKVKRQAPYFTLIYEKVYKRSYSLPLFKCLPPSEAN